MVMYEHDWRNAVYTQNEMPTKASAPLTGELRFGLIFSDVSLVSLVPRK
jgi:hypothetical protein